MEKNFESVEFEVIEIDASLTIFALSCADEINVCQSNNQCQFD